jgi:tight adherence protein C
VDALTFVLVSVSTAGFAAAAGLLGYYAYRALLEQFIIEVRDESTGGARGLASVTIRRLGAANRRLMWPTYELRLRKQLIRGGEPQGYKPEDILALQQIGFVVGLLLGVFACNALEQNFAFSLILAAFAGMYPLIWVNDQVKKRHHKISRALPYNLDLLMLSVEAGLDFTAALAKVVEKGRTGPLRDELQIVLKQLKMGKTREEALKGLIARVDLPSLTTFVTALIQADKMGTSLGKVLRIQSTQMRIDRTQRAEKLANEAPVKMLFPLIACIFPTVFMVLFGPIVFAFMVTGVG